jgi:hypothetical protein
MEMGAPCLQPKLPCLSDKVIIDFDMLGSSMVDGIGGKGECTNIITPDCGNC